MRSSSPVDTWPFAALRAIVSAADAGVLVRGRPGLVVFGVAARRGMLGELRRRLSAHLRLSLPAGPTTASARNVTLVGVGPGFWLAVAEKGALGYRTLRAVLGDAASITEQTDGYAVLRLRGPRIRDALAKGIGVDLDDKAFPPRSAAAVPVAHINCILWRLPSGRPPAPVYEIAVPRSYAGSFAEWLGHSTAEFGLAVED